MPSSTLKNKNNEKPPIYIQMLSQQSKIKKVASSIVPSTVSYVVTLYNLFPVDNLRLNNLPLIKAL